MKKTLIERLLENNIWNFWTSDWSKKVVVKWNGDLKKLKKYKARIEKQLGKDYLIERSVSGAIGMSGRQPPDLIIH